MWPGWRRMRPIHEASGGLMGLAWLPLTISALRASALSAGFLESRCVQVWRLGGQLRQVTVSARLGWVRQPLQTAALGASAPTAALFGEQMSQRSGAARCGEVRHGEVSGQVRIVQGKDCRRQYGGFALPTVLSGTGLAWRCEFWNGFMGHG
jgi:hypothetical protein